MNCIALIVAAGNGSRVSAEVPKQYLKINGKTILEQTIAAFCTHPGIDAVKVVIGARHEDLYEEAIRDFSLLKFTYGEETRQGSVRSGLNSLKELAPKKVIIHDAARPFVSHRIISEVIEMLDDYKAVDVGIDVVDTIKVKPQYGSALLAREKLYATQTPQGFDFDTILRLHENATNQYTDDISLAIAAGVAVGFVKGEPGNVKITHSNDLK